LTIKFYYELSPQIERQETALPRTIRALGQTWSSFDNYRYAVLFFLSFTTAESNQWLRAYQYLLNIAREFFFPFCFCVSVVFKVWDNITNCKDLNFKLRSHDSFISWRLIEFMFLLLSCHRRRTSFTWESLFPSNVKINSASGVNSLHLHRHLHAMRFNRKLTRNVCFQFFFSRKKNCALNHNTQMS